MARPRRYSALWLILFSLSVLAVLATGLALAVSAAPTGAQPEAADGVTTQLAVLLDGSRSIDDWQLAINGLRLAINDPNFPKDGSVELTVIQFGHRVSRREVGPVVITSGNYTEIRSRINNIEMLGNFGHGTPMACAFYRLRDLWSGATVSDTNRPNNESGAWADGVYAFYDGSGAASAVHGQRHQFRGYNLGLPDALVVEGIEVRLDAWRTAGAQRTGSLAVELSWDNGTTWTSTGYSAGPLVGGERVFYLGGPTNTWGHSWTAEEINRLRVRVRAVASEGTTVYLDWIPVTLYYHLTGWDESLRQVVNLASDGNAQCECSDPTGAFNCGDLAQGRASAVAARDALLTALNFDPQYDRIDAEGLDDSKGGMRWMRDAIVWPQPGERVKNQGNQLLFPFNVGWLLDVESRDQFRRAMLFKLLGHELEASITAQPGSGCWPLEVSFEGSVSGGIPPYLFRWRWKDGTRTNLQQESSFMSTSHTFDPGVYSPTLYMVDAVGSWAAVTVPEPIVSEVCLGLTKTDLADPVCSGWRIRYTISLVNSGQVTLHDVLVTDTLPAGTYFVSADTGGIGAYGDPLVTWKVDVPADTMLSLHLEVGTLSTLVGDVTNTVDAFLVHDLQPQPGGEPDDEGIEPQAENGFTWTGSASQTTRVNNCPKPTPVPDTGPGTCPRPGYSDYAPHGLPDFGMQQNGWTGSGWTHSGPAAAADVLWYLDAQAESVLGTKYALVTGYGGNADHSPNNVPPLIEDLAARMGVSAGGVSLEALVDGLGKYLARQGASAAFQVETLQAPSLSTMLNRAVKQNGVPLLLLGFWQKQGESWVRVGGHWVAACCLLADGTGIQFSDPWFDRAAGGFPGRAYGLPPTSPTVYNDAANVSFDEYVPGPAAGPEASWSPAGYGGAALGALVDNSLGMNSAAALAGYAGPFDPGVAVAVAVDYAVYVRPVPGYPGYVTHRVALQEGSRDTYLYRYAPGANYGADPLLKVGYKQTNASLVAFDLSAIPAGAVIEEATLDLYATGWSGADLNLSAYAVRTPWAEGEASWNLALAGVPWAVAGGNGTPGDRAGEPTDSLMTRGPNRWYSFHLTDLVQAWVDGTTANYGVLLRGDGSTNSLILASGQYAEAALRPRLTVHYH
ncbi:MAG: Disaggregatase related repeat protein [Chloroflexi bacterium ADurb.Bin180]|nr:MAG: Disaggregatase related repeat protein [Chloroflexi bacterium ADurb.Bin180]